MYRKAVANDYEGKEEEGPILWLKKKRKPVMNIDLSVQETTAIHHAGKDQKLARS